MTMNVNWLLVVSVTRVVTERLRLESHCFYCRVPLHLIYLHIKFNDEI